MYMGFYMSTNILTWKWSILKLLALVKIKTGADKLLE